MPPPGSYIEEIQSMKSIRGVFVSGSLVQSLLFLEQFCLSQCLWLECNIDSAMYTFKRVY